MVGKRIIIYFHGRILQDLLWECLEHLVYTNDTSNLSQYDYDTYDVVDEKAIREERVGEDVERQVTVNQNHYLIWVGTLPAKGRTEPK